MKGNSSALLAVRPGPLLDALRVLMSTIPGIGIVQEVKDSFAMRDMVIKYQSTLVLLDAGLPGGGDWSAIEQIKAAWSPARVLVLADTCQEKRAARAANADAVLLKGLPPAELVETIECLLPGYGE